MSALNVRLFGPLGFALARCAGAMFAVKTAWERRRLIGQLGALDDHMLRDIGITRQDIVSVLAEPMFRDPSQKLAERADAARLGRRALAEEARRFDLDRAPAARSRPAPERRAA
jgi:uncharacterized protein YjiS (DUF1127 family)